MAFADDYYVYFEDGSDDEYYESTDEEDDIKYFAQELEETKNDFESEMNSELNKVIGGLEEKHHLKVSSDSSKAANNENVNNGSGSSKEEEMKKNDELFYDPNMDDDDQKWVNNSHQCHVLEGNKQSRKTDAILNCPACMTTLCLDCQRHDIYSTQYRAIFVRNCKIDFSQKLEYPDKKSFKGKGSNLKSSNQSAAVYNPVCCSICNTQVAVYDCEEVYHFFNVLASYS